MRKRIVIRGSTYENVLNLGRGYIERIEARYGGTRQGEEELFARLFTDAEGATAKQSDIDKARRNRPDRFARRVIGLDAAITAKGSSDNTGLILAGLGIDGQAYILGDRTGKYTPDRWANVVLDWYEAEQCDCIVVETNKGGDLITQNLRAAALQRKCQVIVLGKQERAKQHMPNVAYVREVYARGEKADRALPLATAYERGMVSHINGAKLEDLEEILTTWVPAPGARSPDRLDAEVHAVVELLGFSINRPDPKASFQGIEKMQHALENTPKLAPDLATLLYGSGGGGGTL